jgi:hypothetical protein
MTIGETIRTAYAPYPGSNVGQIIARGGLRQAMSRWNQSLSAAENHKRAAEHLAQRLGVRVVAEVHSNDAGTRRRFSVIS